MLPGYFSKKKIYNLSQCSQSNSPKLVTRLEPLHRNCGRSEGSQKGVVSGWPLPSASASASATASATVQGFGATLAWRHLHSPSSILLRAKRVATFPQEAPMPMDRMR